MWQTSFSYYLQKKLCLISVLKQRDTMQALEYT